MVIAGVIRNGAGEPLGAVAVSIDVGATLKATATTDTKGQFSIPVPRPGTYSLVDGASWERHDARHRDSGVRHQTCGDADPGGVVVGEHQHEPAYCIEEGPAQDDANERELGLSHLNSAIAISLLLIGPSRQHIKSNPNTHTCHKEAHSPKGTNEGVPYSCNGKR